jgi:metal-responsive CopG/Arc/MetJ family transcriptional regulator
MSDKDKKVGRPTINKEPLKLYNIRLTETELKQIDLYLKKHKQYKNRSEFIRVAIKEKIQQLDIFKDIT